MIMFVSVKNRIINNTFFLVLIPEVVRVESD